MTNFKVGKKYYCVQNFPYYKNIIRWFEEPRELISVSEHSFYLVQYYLLVFKGIEGVFIKVPDVSMKKICPFREWENLEEL